MMARLTALLPRIVGSRPPCVGGKGQKPPAQKLFAPRLRCCNCFSTGLWWCKKPRSSPLTFRRRRLPASMHGRHEMESLVCKELQGLSIALIEITCRKPAVEGAGVSTGEMADVVAAAGTNGVCHFFCTHTRAVGDEAGRFPLHMCTRARARAHTHTHTHTNTYVYEYVCMYVCMCVCMCVCVCARAMHHISKLVLRPVS